VRFKRERFVDVIDEAIPLLEDHFLEIEKQSDFMLNIDKDAYAALDDADVIRLFTVRDVEGKLAGYALFFVHNSLHYKNYKHALQDVLYVKPEYRGFGYMFIDRCDRELKSEGVQMVMHAVSTKCDFSKTLTRLGYELQDTLYARRLDKI